MKIYKLRLDAKNDVFQTAEEFVQFVDEQLQTKKGVFAHIVVFSIVHLSRPKSFTCIACLATTTRCNPLYAVNQLFMHSEKLAHNPRLVNETERSAKVRDFDNWYYGGTSCRNMLPPLANVGEMALA